MGSRQIRINKGNCANSGGKWIRTEKRRAIYVRDNLTCIYCGKGITDGIVFTLDHIVPQSLGGKNTPDNLVTACKTCNSQKGKKSNRAFFAYLRNIGIDTSSIAKRISLARKRKIYVKASK